MAKSKSPFTGSWHIVSMSGWEDEALNEEVQAFIEFDEEGVRIIPVRICPRCHRPLPHKEARSNACG